MAITIMEKEAREVPELIAKQLQAHDEILAKLSARLKKTPPKYALTIGRGSSDHACTYAKYLLETNLGLITASSAPSVVTVYKAHLHMQDALVLGISQSGKSPDICKMMQIARDDGAITVALVNDLNSPLAKTAEFLIPLAMGEERAVAATKSYIGSLVALAHLIAVCADNEKLLADLKQLPSLLTRTLELSWEPAITELRYINNTLVIARGFGFPIAQEAALKLKETSALQAEAFSTAEVLHGPLALIKKNHPYLLFAQMDETLVENIKLAKKITALGGTVILALAGNMPIKATELSEVASVILPLPNSLDAILDPIMIIQAFYPMVARLAVVRGLNPDAPDNLQKVTRTM